MKADPYGFHTETRPATASKLYDIGGFKWTDKSFREKKQKHQVYDSPLNIYEVHLGSWRRRDNGDFIDYRDLAKQLADYVKEMGYTAIELLPVTEQVVFTGNATHGLNIAIRTLVRPGSRVAVSGYEHNAVTRVLHSIRGVEILVVDAPLFRPGEMLEGFRGALRRGVDAVICNHVSNAFGCVQPVEELAELCRRNHTPLIVDASQSAGILPVSLEQWGAAFVAMPGHASPDEQGYFAQGNFCCK